LAVLDLPDSPRTRVWLALVAQLQADPALSACIATWLVWDGTRDCTETGLVEFTGPLSETPTSMKEGAFRPIGTLRIQVIRGLIPGGSYP
jgi:hypothetical protein